ncbi:FecR domain-containing protein [Sphingomonas sp. M1-B02]|uniref:FecR domain-containing protein n=1 Tax=Sphingomonas sp. M1-B02 TaxID=3114300 RepID=UPI00223FBC94|nr:FecR domain-containing protein [Sphingomonas sp. S6-11]UZK67753.1 FecR domain-containing protein [Sphingomonas sp. S6-11]
MNWLFKLPSSILCLLLANAAVAQTADWSVSEASGQVVVRDGKGDRVAKRGTVVPEGAVISTGPDARAVLVKGRDFVTVSANSRIRVPAAEQARGVFQLLQEWGNAVFKIEKKPDPHFGVRTPYLAAVVKGTTFSITVTGQGASLQVVEGAVETSTNDGGASELIRPGIVASVIANDLFRLTVQGQNTRTIDSPQRPIAPAQGPVPAAPPGSSAPSDGPEGAEPTPPQTAVEDPAPIGSEMAVAATEPAIITEAIVGKPVDLGEVTGGLVRGTSAVQLASLEIATTEYTGGPGSNAVSPTPPAEGVVETPRTPIVRAATSDGSFVVELTAADNGPGRPEEFRMLPGSTGSENGRPAGPVIAGKGPRDDVELETAAPDATDKRAPDAPDKPAKDPADAADKSPKDEVKPETGAPDAKEKPAKDPADAADKSPKDEVKPETGAPDAKDKPAKDAADAVDKGAKNDLKPETGSPDAKDKPAKDAADAVDKGSKNDLKPETGSPDAKDKPAKDAADAVSDRTTKDAKEASDKTTMDEARAAKDAAAATDKAAKDAADAIDKAAKDAKDTADKAAMDDAKASKDAADKVAKEARDAADKAAMEDAKAVKDADKVAKDAADKAAKGDDDDKGHRDESKREGDDDD